MVAGRICGVEQVFVGTRIAINILFPGLNLLTVVRLKNLPYKTTSVFLTKTI